MADSETDQKSMDEVYRERNLNSLGLLKALKSLAEERGVDAEMGYWPTEDGWVVVWVNIDSVREVLKTDPDESQVSWHVPENIVPDWLDKRNHEYDGYSTAEKNDRLEDYIYP